MLLGINNHEMVTKEEEEAEGGHPNKKSQALTQVPKLRPKTHWLRSKDPTVLW